MACFAGSTPGTGMIFSSSTKNNNDKSKRKNSNPDLPNITICVIIDT
jgi:hypothetical protein